jgi:hypothetical protein
VGGWVGGWVGQMHLLVGGWVGGTNAPSCGWVGGWVGGTNGGAAVCWPATQNKPRRDLACPGTQKYIYL